MATLLMIATMTDSRAQRDVMERPPLGAGATSQIAFRAVRPFRTRRVGALGRRSVNLDERTRGGEFERTARPAQQGDAAKRDYRSPGRGSSGSASVGSGASRSGR